MPTSVTSPDQSRDQAKRRRDRRWKFSENPKIWVPIVIETFFLVLMQLEPSLVVYLTTLLI